MCVHFPLITGSRLTYPEWQKNSLNGLQGGHCRQLVPAGHVEMYLRQLVERGHWTLWNVLVIVKFNQINQKAAILSLPGLEGPFDSLAWWRLIRCWLFTSWWIHAFPWSSTIIFFFLFSMTYTECLASAAFPSCHLVLLCFTQTSDKQQAAADVAECLSQSVSHLSSRDRSKKGGEQLQTAAAEDRHHPAVHLFQLIKL